MSTPPAPTDEEMAAVSDVTTDEMLAWLDQIMETGDSLEWSELDGYDAAIARAIAERLRAPSAGKSDHRAGIARVRALLSRPVVSSRELMELPALLLPLLAALEEHERRPSAGKSEPQPGWQGEDV